MVVVDMLVVIVLVDMGLDPVYDRPFVSYPIPERI